MTPTWGISGPLFLLLWFPLVVVTAFLPRLALVAARGGPREAPDPTVSPQQLGALVAGGDRVVAASVAGLLERGRLRMDGSRELSAVTGPVPPEDDPGLSDVDVEVLRGASSPRTAGRLVAAARSSTAVADVAQQLVARGLVRDPAAMRRRAQWAWLPFALVAAVGLARLGAGLGHSASVGFLVALLVVGAVVALLARPRSMQVPTPRGRATVEAARLHARRASTGHPAAVIVGGAALLVAVGGFAAFPDPELAGLLSPVLAGGGSADGGSWSDSGSSCGSSSSSCGGGGGCGGGGCGG